MSSLVVSHTALGVVAERCVASARNDLVVETADPVGVGLADGRWRWNRVLSQREALRDAERGGECEERKQAG